MESDGRRWADAGRGRPVFTVARALELEVGAERVGRAVAPELCERRFQALPKGARPVPYWGEGGREEGEEGAGERVDEADLEGDARNGEAVAGG